MLGLELGADDYITKPFSVREFRSRVKAVLRRAALSSSGRARGGADQGGRPARWTSSAGRSSIRGEAVQLTYVEFEILAALAAVARPGAQPDHPARARLGRQRVPRPAHDRRAHPPPAREARARLRGARADPHRARRGLPLPRPLIRCSGSAPSATSWRCSSSASRPPPSRSSTSWWCRSSSRTSRAGGSRTSSRSARARTRAARGGAGGRGVLAARSTAACASSRTPPTRA